MSAAADLGIRALASYCLASCQCLPRPHRLSAVLLCLTFCLLSIFAMFSTLLGLTEIKNYTISLFDFFAKNISPTLFAFFGFYSIDIVFALFVLCYIKCCKFVLILQSSSLPFAGCAVVSYETDAL